MDIVAPTVPHRTEHPPLRDHKKTDDARTHARHAPLPTDPASIQTPHPSNPSTPQYHVTPSPQPTATHPHPSSHNNRITGTAARPTWQQNLDYRSHEELYHKAPFAPSINCKSWDR